MPIKEFIQNPQLLGGIIALVLLGYLFHFLKVTVKNNTEQSKQFRDDAKEYREDAKRQTEQYREDAKIQTEQFLKTIEHKDEKVISLTEQNIQVNGKLERTLDKLSDQILGELQRIKAEQSQGFADLREDVGKVQNTLSQIQWTQGGNRND